MSKYITKKRMKEAGIAGHVNIPYGTEVEEVDGLIIYKGAAVCAITSRNAHLHFAKNDDGKGLERGALTLAITFRLEKRDAGYQGRWDLVWEDPVCQKYRRPRGRRGGGGERQDRGDPGDGLLSHLRSVPDLQQHRPL